MKLLRIRFCLCLIIFVQNVISYKILCAFPSPSRSHFIVAEALFRGLAYKGHNVTVLTTYPSNISTKNYQEISIATVKPPPAPFFTREAGNMFSLYKNVPLITDMSIFNVRNLLIEEHVRKLMDTESFDLIIFEGVFGNALLGLGAHFKCPMVLFQSFNPMYSIHRLIGNPLALPYLSNPCFQFDNVLSFKSRVKIMLLYFTDYFFMDLPFYDKHKRTYEEFFPSPQYPSYDKMLKNISLHLVATHFSQNNVRPLVPSMIEIGGIHVQDKKSPLPDSLQKWMDESTDGVVYFSLGSNMLSAGLPDKIFNEILTAFGSIKLNVLWKFENDTYQFPKNILASKWLPQCDILNHKNLKLFITHGGLGSVTEAKFYGVPLIVVPMFGDQMPNADLVASQGWGVQFPFFELNSERLLKSIHEVVSNPKYADQAKQISIIYRDRQNTALETGIFWMEYVIRHHGAKHLQSNAVDLNIFQYHSLDVIGFFGLIVSIFILTIYNLLSYIIGKISKPVKIKIQ